MSVEEKMSQGVLIGQHSREEFDRLGISFAEVSRRNILDTVLINKVIHLTYVVRRGFV